MKKVLLIVLSLISAPTFAEMTIWQTMEFCNLAVDLEKKRGDLSQHTDEMLREMLRNEKQTQNAFFKKVGASECEIEALGLAWAKAGIEGTRRSISGVKDINYYALCNEYVDKTLLCW